MDFCRNNIFESALVHCYCHLQSNKKISKQSSLISISKSKYLIMENSPQTFERSRPCTLTYVWIDLKGSYDLKQDSNRQFEIAVNFGRHSDPITGTNN